MRPSGFTVDEITSYHPSNSKLGVGSLTIVEKDKLLHQSFTDLSNCKHCYIIQFFKKKQIRTK